MSIRLKRYIGRLGNQLFQYAAARYVANRNNLFLETDWPHNDFLKVLPWQNNGRRIRSPIVVLNDMDGRANPQKNMLNGDFKNCCVELNGYYQDVSYFNNARESIRGWFEPCILGQNTKDWVLHYRVTDYWHKEVDSVIHPDWFIGILKSNGYFDNRNGDIVFLVTDDADDLCVKELKAKIGPYCLISKNNDPKIDFNFIRSFDRIICSNSSFAWWAAFLGRPKACFTFKPWMKYSKRNLADMVGATPVDGQFAINKEMQEKNLKGAWQK
jgi:Glycosyl transferase family 11.